MSRLSWFKVLFWATSLFVITFAAGFWLPPLWVLSAVALLVVVVSDQAYLRCLERERGLR